MFDSLIEIIIIVVLDESCYELENISFPEDPGDIKLATTLPDVCIVDFRNIFLCVLDPCIIQYFNRFRHLVLYLSTNIKIS